MNPLLSKLQPYPFERLAKLKANAPYLGDKSHIAERVTGEFQRRFPHCSRGRYSEKL